MALMERLPYHLASQPPTHSLNPGPYRELPHPPTTPMSSDPVDLPTHPNIHSTSFPTPTYTPRYPASQAPKATKFVQPPISPSAILLLALCHGDRTSRTNRRSEVQLAQYGAGHASQLRSCRGSGCIGWAGMCGSSRR